MAAPNFKWNKNKLGDSSDDPTGEKSGAEAAFDSDKIEGAGEDKFKNQFNTDLYGTQTTERIAGTGDTGFTRILGNTPTSKLEGLKSIFGKDPEVMDIIDDEIANRAKRAGAVPGRPEGMVSVNISESAAQTVYSDADIAKQTSFASEELATINKYLDEVPDIAEDVRANLAAEGARLIEEIEIEKFRLGQSAEELVASQRLIEATGNLNQLDRDIVINKGTPFEQVKNVTELATEDVGKATSPGFEDKMFEQRKRATGNKDLGLYTKKGVGSSVVREMDDLWGKTEGILGDAKGAVEQKTELVKKGDTLSTGGKAKTTGMRVVKESFPLDDKQMIALGEADKKITSIQKAIDYETKLQERWTLQFGEPDMEYNRNIEQLQKDLKSAKGTRTRIANNLQPIADDVKGKPDYGVWGDTDKGTPPKGPIVNPGSGRPASVAPPSYADIKKMERAGSSLPDNYVPFDAESELDFKSQVPTEAQPKTSDYNVSSKIEDSPNYQRKYTEVYNRTVDNLTEGVTDFKNVDPVIARRAAEVAAAAAAWFAKRNPGTMAGLMMYTGLKNLRNKEFNKSREQDYFK